MSEKAYSADDYELSKEKSDLILKWLIRSWPQMRCPMCNTARWDISRHLLSPMIYSPDKGFLAGVAAYPFFSITCGKCGFTAQFAARMVAGLLGDNQNAK